MSFEPCVCGTGGQNTGQPACVPTIKRTAKLIIMQTIANDGTFNSIKESDFVAGVLPDAFIIAKINEPDESKRWRVTEKINLVTDVRAEPITQDIDGIPVIVDQGTRVFTGSFIGNFGSPQFAGVLNSFQCFNTSYFEISVEGAIVGLENDTELLPIPIETGTLQANVVRGTKTEVNAVSLTFAMQELARDENLIQIATASIEPNMLLKKGLIDVVGKALAIPAITATTVRLDMSFIYGNFPERNDFEGLLAADLSFDDGSTPMTVFNVDQAISVAVSSVVPVVGFAGLYDVTIAAGGLTTEVILVALSKPGFEMDDFTYVIP